MGADQSVESQSLSISWRVIGYCILYTCGTFLLGLVAFASPVGFQFLPPSTPSLWWAVLASWGTVFVLGSGLVLVNWTIYRMRHEQEAKKNGGDLSTE
jgi:hypothetical protein